MSHEGNGQPIPYRIDISEQTAGEIKQLKRSAAKQGLSKAFTAAYKSIIQRLKTNPSDFGELIRIFPHLQLVEHVATVPPLTVRFSYHEENRIVIIMKVFLNQP